jgi:hypothetical protein
MRGVHLAEITARRHSLPTLTAERRAGVRAIDYHRSMRRVRSRSARRGGVAFVVTLAVAPACKKADVVDASTPARIADRGDGTCLYVHKTDPCPPNATCNPPGPETIECPPGMGDAATASSSARPPGKEGWYKIPAQLVANPYNGCFYEIEGYCAPLDVDRCELGGNVKVACKAIDETLPPNQRRFALAAFDYKDSFGVCHHVAATECAAGACPMPETTNVPCAQ